MESLGKVLKPLGHVIRTEPDHFVKDADDAKVIELLDKIPVAANIKYKIWKSEKEPYINNMVRVQLVDRVLPQPDYMTYFKTQVAIFRGHVYQIKEHFIHIKNTKIHIRLGEIVIQMDFTEKFTALEFYRNIQGTHWANNLVTILTIVVYYLIEGVEGVQHKSFVDLSPVGQHNGIMVFAILKLLWHRDLPCFFFSGQNINLAHYVTDGPGSQYKSRVIF